MPKKMTFETASAQLDEIYLQLSSEEVSLEMALDLYAKAAKLIAFCNTALQEAQLKIEEIDASLLPQ